MFLSAFFFSLMNIFVRYTAEIPIFQQLISRNLIIAIGMFIALALEKNLKNLKVEDGKMPLFLRCTFGFLGMITNFYAVNHMAIADVSAITKMSPFFVMVFAALILKEKLRGYSIFALILSISGMFIVIRPNLANNPGPAMIAVISAIGASLAYTMLGVLKNKVRSEVIIFYFGLYSTLGCLPFIVGNFHIPDLKEALLLIMIGITAGLGQLFVTLAYKYAPASEVSIYNFSAIPIGIILGLICFGEKVDSLSLIGMAMIIGAGYYNYKMAKKVQEAET